MTDYNDFNIFDFEASLNHNSTIMDDDFIGGTSVIIIGVVSFFVVIIIIIAIHLFSKKLNSIDCENGYQQFDNPLEEMEPLPQYEERETRLDGEVDLSDYIQANNTINTIPRDTMNIINILSSTSQRNMHVSFTDTPHSPPSSPPPTITDNYDGNNSHHDHDHQVNNDDLNDLLSIPSTSTLPLPRPKRESIPNIPPPCYDIALTQPRISNQGMIVLPQDPSFATNLPILLRNSSSHRHILRRSRQRLMRFFTHHRTSSPLNNNYRLPNHSSSVNSHSSTISSSSSNSDSNLNSFYHNHDQQQHNQSSDTNDDNRSSPSISRRSRNHESRSRAFLNRLHHTHIHSSSVFSRRRRRHRSNLLRIYGSMDNDSISSVSIYPTIMVDIPEDHYNISGMNCHEVRSTIIPEIERGYSTTTSMIPCINDSSASIQSISTADNIHSTTTQVVSTADNVNPITTQSIPTIHTTTLSNVATHHTDIQASSSSSEVLNNTETWVDVTQYNPSLINHEGDINNFNSMNDSHHNHEFDSSSNNDHTPSIPNEYVSINTTTINKDYHQIIINDEATHTENENENKNENENENNNGHEN